MAGEAVKSFTYHFPTKMVVGPNKLDELGRIGAELGKKALIVTDLGVEKALGLTEKISALLEEAGVGVEVFNDIEPNPSVKTIEQGAAAAKKQGANLIVGVGGGSVLDAAKGIAIVAKHGRTIWDYIGGDKVPGPVAKIVAIPTTSGTGSESTPFGVYSNKESRRKDGLYSPYIFPAVSILDGALLRGMPPWLTADTGLDALAHAIEAYTGKSANVMSDAAGEKAMALVARYLPMAVTNGGDLEARQGMALASALAGVSITHAGVGAAHGFGMSIGGLFDQGHGRTIGILLPPVMAYNAAALPERFARIAAIFKEANATLYGPLDSAAEMVALLLRKLGVPEKLSALGIGPGEVKAILDDCLGRGDFANNPRPFSRAEATAFLEKVI